MEWISKALKPVLLLEFYHKLRPDPTKFNKGGITAKSSTHTPIKLVIPSFFSLTFPEAFDAYLDPGTGSIIFQVIIATLVGGLFAVKLFWNKISSFFKKLFSRGEKDEEPGE